MITINEIVTRLNGKPDEFKKHMNAGEYAAAKWCYIKTAVVAGFIELDDERRDKLMSRFDEKDVDKAFRGGADDKR